MSYYVYTAPKHMSENIEELKVKKTEMFFNRSTSQVGIKWAPCFKKV